MDEFKITITDAAEKAMQAMLDKSGLKQMRLGVKGSGCSGFSWVLQPARLPPTDKDISIDIGSFVVLIDPKSALFLNGTVIDYESGLMKEGFSFKSDKIVSKCGCGKSFDLKREV